MGLFVTGLRVGLSVTGLKVGLDEILGPSLGEVDALGPSLGAAVLQPHAYGRVSSVAFSH